jgi:hypothetical protein
MAIFYERKHMGKIIGYAKLGRSMPLTLDKCGNLGGDVEMVAVVKELALRHPDDHFMLLGRNTGEAPSDVGLPANVSNPWHVDGGNWSGKLRHAVAANGLKGVTLTPERQLTLAKIFDEITESAFDSLDGMVMWIGQHGTSNTPIPKVSDPSELTKPQDWCAWYSGYLLRGINRWRDVNPWNREEISLNADARNRHKMRDLKWPLRHPILTQYNFSHPLKHERYGDTSNPAFADHYLGWSQYAKDIGQNTWQSTVQNAYARLEVNGLRPGTPFGDLISYNDDWNRPGHFGLFINEARKQVSADTQRVSIMREWVLPLRPHFIHGSWSDESRRTLDRDIQPAPWNKYYPALHSVRCTFTTPSSGSGWATAKPWEAFAAGTVCFFHPKYDTQNNILKDAQPALNEWLRVKDYRTLKMRVQHLSSEAGRADWEWLIATQRAHFDTALSELTYMKMIEDRLYG